MFTEPQSVTVNAVAKSLVRVSTGDRKAIYENSVEGMSLNLSHANGKRKRHTVRLDIEKIAADAFLDGVSKPFSMSAYLVIDRPLQGITDTEAGYYAQALIDWLDVAGNITKVIGGES